MFGATPLKTLTCFTVVEKIAVDQTPIHRRLGFCVAGPNTSSSSLVSFIYQGDHNFISLIDPTGATPLKTLTCFTAVSYTHLTLPTKA